MLPVPNISFSVNFDLTGSPVLVITDTSTHGLSRVASFDITQPDNYTRPGDILSPDLTAGQNVFTIPLRLDSLGKPQIGIYTIVMRVRVAGYEDTTFTRTWTSSYTPVSLNIGENYDVFTPNLSVRDNTSYAVSNFNNGSVTRSWVVSSIPTGTLTGSSVTQSFIKNGYYYSALYSVSLTSSIVYTHQVYTWFTVSQQLSKSIQSCIQAPPDFAGLVADISDLKDQLDDAVNKCLEYGKLKADFEYAQVLFMHILDRVKTAQLSEVYSLLIELLTLLSGNQIPVCNPNNQIIPQYNISFINGTPWGTITGNIQNQTDLWAIITDLYVRDHYVHNQPTPSNTWTVNHNMGKNPSVSIIDSSGDEVYGEVKHISTSQLILSFSAPFSGIAYLN